ncbi:hypothetical protein [Vibrio alginolyticus]|uniref:hypothetical protein n=1 Tax=Vibrio alginolyticus TaxID=663 RepID=UPI002FF14E18
MKFSQAVFFIFAGIVGVLFGGLFLGLILDRFFSGELETGDMATWAAAFGTVFTLVFLTVQHSQNTKHQNYMWKKQELMLDFQRALEHKKQFELFIDGIEASNNNFLRFFDTERLYRELFPMNTSFNEYSDYQYRILDKPDSDSNYLLVKLDNLLVEATTCLNEAVHNQTITEEDITIFPPLFLNLLKIDIIKENRIGDVREKSGHYVSNALNIHELIQVMYNIHLKLCSFCGYTTLLEKQCLFLQQPLETGLALYQQIQKIEHCNVNLGPYCILLILHDLNALCQALSPEHFLQKQYEEIVEKLTYDKCLEPLYTERAIKKIRETIIIQLSHPMWRQNTSQNTILAMECLSNLIEAQLAVNGIRV